MAKMRKASKWIKNFMLGKKEEKERKGTVESPVNITASSTAIVLSTPRVRRRWSFGRSVGKEILQHKLSKSLDALDTGMLPLQLVTEYAKRKNNSPEFVTSSMSKEIQDQAATKIQAVFRSFLARKALWALRGLVKIQALVRGHLIRKRTTATLRCMHALMTIQVRARVHRIQMAKGEQDVFRNQPSLLMHQHFHGNKVLREASKLQRLKGIPDDTKYCFPEMQDMPFTIVNGRTNDPRNQSQREHRPIFYSGELSKPKYEHQNDEKSNTVHNSLGQYQSKTRKPSPIPESVSHTVFYRPEYLNQVPNEHLNHPNYMANTKSSKAKERAQSLPKQRPDLGTREKARRSTSTEGAGVCPVNYQRYEEYHKVVNDQRSTITMPVNPKEHCAASSGNYYSTYSADAVQEY